MTKWIIAVLIVISPLVVDAQCSMCKAVAESSQDGGSSIAEGDLGIYLYRCKSKT